MISYFRNHSLTIKLTASFLIFLLIPIYITQIILFLGYKSNMDSLIKNYLMKSYENIYETANNRFSDMVNSSTYFTLNSEFNDILDHSYNGIDRQLNEDVKKMDSFFDFAQSITKLNKIYYTLVLNDGRIFGNWGTLPDFNWGGIKQWLDGVMKQVDGLSWAILDEPCLFGGSSTFTPPLVSVLRKVGNDKGILIISIEYPTITDFLELNELPDKNITTLIYNKNGEIMYGSSKALTGDIAGLMPEIVRSSVPNALKIRNKGGYYVFYKRLSSNNFTLVQIVNESAAYNSALYMRNGFMIISFAFLILYIGVTYLISFGTTRSIKKLEAAMKRFGEGDLNIEVKNNASDEIGELTGKFNKMVKQIQYLIGELQENEREKAKIYYESLIAQINPHFLYNTLNSIKWTAALSNAPNVVNLLISLGTLLEASTSRKGDIVTLNQEIEYVKHYMNLEYSRFGEKIKLHFCIPSEAKKLLIPKFIIQPIVENSIIHAFDQHEIKGDIFIHAKLQESCLMLFIKDNGKGISHEKIMEILGDDNDKPSQSKRLMGIGISSVQKRIQILYGKSYGLTFSTEIGVGTTFRLKLPVCTDQEMPGGNGGNHV